VSRYLDIMDPQGFIHRLEVDGNHVFGYENIAHGFDRSIGASIIQDVITVAAMPVKFELPHGFFHVEYAKKN
jgi:hypothetical protein